MSLRLYSEWIRMSIRQTCKQARQNNGPLLLVTLPQPEIEIRDLLLLLCSSLPQNTQATILLLSPLMRSCRHQHATAVCKCILCCFLLLLLLHILLLLLLLLLLLPAAAA
jgi:hypothetical protein